MQRRASAGDAQRVRLLHAFGRLIGNSDMHFGNLSLWTEEPASGRFSLAPCSDAAAERRSDNALGAGSGGSAPSQPRRPSQAPCGANTGAASKAATTPVIPRVANNPYSPRSATGIAPSL